MTSEQEMYIKAPILYANPEWGKGNIPWIIKRLASARQEQIILDRPDLPLMASLEEVVLYLESASAIAPMQADVARIFFHATRKVMDKVMAYTYYPSPLDTADVITEAQQKKLDDLRILIRSVLIGKITLDPKTGKSKKLKASTKSAAPNNILTLF
jgi:hypothetical protein